MVPDRRAQTSIDFAIGIAIFLVTLTTVVAFMPTMTQPFTTAQNDPLMADRLAAQVVDDQLGDPASPSVLNTTCTMYFFNGSDTPSDPCDSFDPTHETATKLGAGNESLVNVTIRRNVTGDATPDILCATAGGEDLKELSNCGGVDTVLANGSTPPDVAGSVTIARRFAVFNGEGTYVVVKVWT
jgi:hypothetical protein